ncbi:MAG TPA: hypothetical protein VJ441_02940 [Dehalococcoidia bacterium]|nr:hypothetical protein [Dehalococcoidia bacterium]
MIKLRPYQQEVARAILDSIQSHKGLTFSVEIARQGGKNELSAIIELTLLTLYMAKGGNAIKASPTFKPQTIISMMRLKQRLNEYGFAGIWQSEMGYIIRLGEARQLFLSTDESSSVVGHTADILLEIDESQDVSKEKYTKEFRPMGSATNVTTVHYGTTWDTSTLLEEVKQQNLELERKDGIKRHFCYSWQEVAKYNPAYLRYVEAEKERLGENHPLFLTQYALVPIYDGGGFLNLTQRTQLQGGHPRRHHRESGKIYIAGIDLAGEAEEGEDAALRVLKPRQDSTVVIIGELDFSALSTGRLTDVGQLSRDRPSPTLSESNTSDRSKDLSLLPYSPQQPKINIVEHYWWTGKPHTELYSTLVDLLKNVWDCKRIVVDATGIGEPVASFLRQALGSKVIPFKFTQRSKSELGFELLAAINSGRLKMYAADDSPEYREFWFEMEKARSHYRPSQTINFYVDPAEGHDDFLISLALLVEAADQYKPRNAKGSL